MGDKPRWKCDGAKFGKRRKCVCVRVSRDLLNRPWFQFHASEFDRGGGGGRRRRRGEGPQPVMFPQGGGMAGWR